jgi:hypothetical protein
LHSIIDSVSLSEFTAWFNRADRARASPKNLLQRRVLRLKLLAKLLAMKAADAQQAVEAANAAVGMSDFE